MNTLTTKYDLPTFGDYAVAALKVLIVVLLLVILWLIIDKITSFDDEKELFGNRNMAYAVLRISIVACQVVALLPLVAVNTGGSVWDDVGPLLGWGVAVTVVVLLLNLLLDRVFHRGGGSGELAGISMADAVSRGGLYIATGLIFNALHEPPRGDGRGEDQSHRAGPQADQDAPAQYELPLLLHQHGQPTAGSYQDQRTGDDSTNAEPVHQCGGKRRGQPEEHQVDPHRERHRSTRPTELCLQRDHQDARSGAEPGGSQ